MSALTHFGPSTGLANAVLGQQAPLLLDPELRVKTPALQRMLDVWTRKRGERRMPSRAAFGMRDLSGALPELCIVDIVHEGSRRRFKVRLMGTSLENHLAPITGKYVDEAVPPHFADRWEKMYTSAIDRRAPMRICSRVAFRNQLYLIGEGVMLPVADDGETPSGLIIAIFHYGSDEHDEKHLQLYQALARDLDQAAGPPDAVTS